MKGTTIEILVNRGKIKLRFGTWKGRGRREQRLKNNKISNKIQLTTTGVIEKTRFLNFLLVKKDELLSLRKGHQIMVNLAEWLIISYVI